MEYDCMSHTVIEGRAHECDPCTSYCNVMEFGNDVVVPCVHTEWHDDRHEDEQIVMGPWTRNQYA